MLHLRGGYWLTRRYCVVTKVPPTNPLDGFVKATAAAASEGGPIDSVDVFRASGAFPCSGNSNT